MVKKEKACRDCGRLSDQDLCIYCKTQTSQDWIGYVSIIDPDKSRIADRLEIKIKGKYALRVK